MPLSVRREVGDMNHQILAAVQPPEIHYFGQDFGKISAPQFRANITLCCIRLHKPETGIVHRDLTNLLALGGAATIIEV